MYYNLSLFQSRLKDLMNRKGLRQTTLALEVDIAPDTIWTYISGRTIPQAFNLVSLAEFFEVSTDYLLGMTYEKPEDIDIIVKSLFPDLTGHQVMVLSSIIAQYRIDNQNR